MHAAAISWLPAAVNATQTAHVLILTQPTLRAAVRLQVRSAMPMRNAARSVRSLRQTHCAASGERAQPCQRLTRAAAQSPLLQLLPLVTAGCADQLHMLLSVVAVTEQEQSTGNQALQDSVYMGQPHCDNNTSFRRACTSIKSSRPSPQSSKKVRGMPMIVSQGLVALKLFQVSARFLGRYTVSPAQMTCCREGRYTPLAGHVACGGGKKLRPLC